MTRALYPVYVYVRSNELKKAIQEYAADTRQAVYDIIGKAWAKMLDSKDYSINVNRVYDYSAETGVSVKDNQYSRRMSLTMDPDLADAVQGVFTDLKEKGVTGVNWSSWTQESIRRYLEPELIEKGYLKRTIFKDKVQAAKNIKFLRISKGKTQTEFVESFLTVNGEKIISLPQYGLIERSGKGNVEKIVTHLAQVLDLDEEIFYDEEFKRFINRN